MSAWQGYVDNLVGSGNVTKAAVAGHDGNMWAISPGWKVTSAELLKIIPALSKPAALDSLRANGMFVAGDKFLVLKADDRSIYAKKGATGVVIGKSKQAVVVGFYDDKIQPGNCTNQVEKMVDYLIDQNY